MPKLVLGFMHGDSATASRVVGVFGIAWRCICLGAALMLAAACLSFTQRPRPGAKAAA